MISWNVNMRGLLVAKHSQEDFRDALLEMCQKHETVAINQKWIVTKEIGGGDSFCRLQVKNGSLQHLDTSSGLMSRTAFSFPVGYSLFSYNQETIDRIKSERDKAWITLEAI